MSDGTKPNDVACTAAHIRIGVLGVGRPGASRRWAVKWWVEGAPVKALAIQRGM